ncbi:hypothetical protein HYE68_008936 [Fusarium pseudograminearum]|nr:hypothetical protein HYE68_008936 [Fusarium pseudograminearum]
MEPLHLSASQTLICTDIPVTSDLGQALCRGGYSVDGDSLNKDEALIWAIMEDQIELVKAIVKDGVNIDLGRGPLQTPTLSIAAGFGSTEIISILMDAGASLEKTNTVCQSPLHTAAWLGKTEAFELLCDFGADIKYTSNYGVTPLHYAASRGFCDIIQLLFDRNIDVDCRDDEESTPLLFAIQEGQIQAVQLLIKLGADIGLQDKNGNTALHHAAYNDHETIFKYLIELGVNLAAINNHGYSVLSLAAHSKAQNVVNYIVQLEDVDVNQQDQLSAIVPLISAAMSGSLDIARLLVKNGALLEVSNSDGNTPLHHASAYGHPEVARFLLEKGANIESRNNNQKTPFLLAALSGQVRVVRLLAEHGADRDARDSDGFCALHYAFVSQNNLLLRCLLVLGVDMEVEFLQGSTVLERANMMGRTEIASYLVEFGANTMLKGKEKCTVPQRSLNDQLITCSKHGNMAQIMRLLDQGVDVNVLNTSGRSAISVAAEHGHRCLIDLLLERGALLNLQDSNGETALWWASQCNHIGVVQRLLELGADTDLSDSDGNSPLCVACQNGLVDIAKRLLEAGSNLNVMTAYSMTPLLLAANANHVEVVGLLIDKGGVTLEHIVQAVKGGSRPDVVANMMRYLDDRYGHQILNRLGLEKHVEDANEGVSSTNDTDAPRQKNDTNPADDCDDLIYGDQLASAASKGLVPAMNRLLKAGANVNGSKRAAIPLVWAVRQNQLRAAQALIESGAQIDSVDHLGDTALCLAAQQGNKTIIDLLCKHHANIEHKGWMTSTPLTFAVKGGHADAVEILLDRGAKTEVGDSNLAHPLEIAASEGFEPIIDVLIRKGVNMRMVGRTGRTPLLHAVIGGQRHVAQTLLKNGAGCDLIPGSKFSPLAQAVFSGQAVMVELLAKHGADINHLENTDQTPLIIAAQSGKDMVVQSLIDMGADLDGKDDKGRTALSYAKENGHQSTVKLLLQAQALRREGQYLKKAEEQRKDPRTSFEYRPLPKGFIRVLELQPGQKGNVVCFSLIQVELSESPSFEALSYEWKGKVGTVPTRCDGDRILVTPNCYTALETLRSKTETKNLWIDAICINQRDNSERGIQVSMMYEIYSKANSVLMWIGEERDDSDLAFASIPVLSLAMEQVRKSPYFTPVSIGQGNNKDLLLGLPEIRHLTEQLNVDPKTWEAWYKLCRRSYFTRAWIFQEIILAGPRGTVMCGTRRVSWDTFKSALQAYSELQIDYCLSMDAIIVIDAHFRLLRWLTFEVALFIMSRFEVGDPRDKIFAALGLAFGSGRQDQPWNPVQVPKEDYNKSVEEVFIHANRYVISYDGGKDLWALLDPINQSITTGGKIILPSWVFDFSKPPISIDHPFPTDSADYHVMLRGRPMTTQTSLHVNGYVIDQVNCKVPITKDESTVDVVKTVIRYVAASGRGVYDPSPTIGRHSAQSGSDEDLGKGYSRTNLAALLNTLMELHDCPTDDDMSSAAYVAWRLITDNETSEISKAPLDLLQDGIQAWEKSSKESDVFDLDICSKMECRHRYDYDLVYTDKGYFGLAPRRDGDEGLVVTLIGGCKDLVLLRRKASGGDTWYEYVSKVYMYGWTKDKIKTVEDLGDDLEEVRFEIR